MTKSSHRAISNSDLYGSTSKIDRTKEKVIRVTLYSLYFVKYVLVFTCVYLEGQQGHALADLFQLIIFKCWEKFACMFDSAQTVIVSYQLNKFLDTQLEFNVWTDFSEFGFVIVTPGYAFGCIVSSKILFNFACSLKNFQIGQIFYSFANGKSFGRFIVAETQKMFNYHSIESCLFPFIGIRNMKLGWNILSNRLTNMIQTTFTCLYRR